MTEPHPLRCVLIRCCAECPNSRQKGDGYWYCNPKDATPWKRVLDGKPILPKNIPVYCPLPIYNDATTSAEQVLDKLIAFCDEEIVHVESLNFSHTGTLRTMQIRVIKSKVEELRAERER